MPNPINTAALVIGYGNPLRGDDGLGPYIAASIERQRLPRVRAVTVHQLLPELAEELSAAALAVFVDASLETAGDEVEVKAIDPEFAAVSMTHVLDPRTLLALAQALYGRAPQAWSVHIAGDCFEPGEGLSELAKRRAEIAVQEICALLTNANPTRKRGKPTKFTLLALFEVAQFLAPSPPKHGREKSNHQEAT